MEEGKGERYLATGRQYGNALLGVRHQEEKRSSSEQYISAYLGDLLRDVLPHVLHRHKQAVLMRVFRRRHGTVRIALCRRLLERARRAQR